MDNLTRHLVAVFALAFGTPNFALGSPQVIMTGHHRQVGAIACTPPTGLTSRWLVGDPSTTCVGPTSCTNTASLFQIQDLISGNTLGTITPPTYTTGAVNGHAAASFVYASHQDLNFNTPLPSSGALTLYVVLQPTTYTATDIIVGNNSVSPTGSFIWLINTSGNQLIASTGQPAIGTGTFTIPTTSYSILATSYNFTTGAWTMWHCSSGTCTSDGSGTSAETFSQPMTTIGVDHIDTLFLGAEVAEFGYSTSVLNPNTIGLGTYGLCYFGI